MSTTPAAPPSSERPASDPARGSAANPPAKTATAPPAEEGSQDEDHGATTGRFILFNATPSWAVSAVVHFVMFIVLALMQVPERSSPDVTTISSRPPEVVEQI